MAKEQNWTPWYRRKEYKGNLTEEEKRHLDSFRLDEKHPAAAVEDLPEEVQGQRPPISCHFPPHHFCPLRDGRTKGADKRHILPRSNPHFETDDALETVPVFVLRIIGRKRPYFLPPSPV